MKACMNRKWGLGTAFAATASLLSAQASAEVVVGIAGPFTGGVAFLGEQLEIGSLRAVADINAAGGVLGETVSMVLVDDGCNPEQAKAAAQQLVSSSVAFVNGHMCSGATIAASPVYEEAGIVVMSPASTNPRVTDESGTNVFRVIGRDDDQAVVAADVIASEFAGQRVAVISGKSQYGSELAIGLISELEKLGIAPTLALTFEPNAGSYADIVDQMVAAEIELAFLSDNSPSDMGVITLQAREALPDVQFLSADALSGQDFLLVAGDAAVGALFTFGPDPRNLASAEAVTNAIRDEEFFEPSGYTLYSYAVIQTWAQAVEAAGTFDSSALIETLQNTEFDTIIGKIGFDEAGDITGVENFVIYEYGVETYSQRP